MKPDLIDNSILKKMTKRIQNSIPKPKESSINYFNIFGIFFIVLIPAILYYRYSTKKKRGLNIINHIRELNNYSQKL